MKQIRFLFFLLASAIGMQVGMQAQTVSIYHSGSLYYQLNQADSVMVCQAPVETYRFSVADDKQVVFSSGNLQYTRSTGSWSFAEQQYEFIGADNIVNDTLADKIDLFGWSTTNSATPFGASASVDDYEYIGDFVDWGTNRIGTDAPGTWRTLTQDEWNYLFTYRTNAAQLYGVARINLNGDGSEFANGLIVLPDGWVCPRNVTFKSGFNVNVGIQEFADHQTFDLADWRILESSGAVFLPAAGTRYGTYTEDIQKYGYYWSSTRKGDEESYKQIIRAMHIYPLYGFRRSGCSVRLVQDIDPANGRKVPTAKIYKSGCLMHSVIGADSVVLTETEMHPVFSVGDDTQVVFAPGNLQYTRSTGTWSFAEHQYDALRSANLTEDGELADRIDLFGWSTNNAAAPFGVSGSDQPADYTGDFVDWGRNTIGTDAPDTWRTLTQKEWHYLFFERKNGLRLWGVARINLNDDGSEFANGLVILPDDWTRQDWEPIVKFGSTEATGAGAYTDYQTFTMKEWLAIEAAGAVFLPTTGERQSTSGLINERVNGQYWSATPVGANDYLSYSLQFTPQEVKYDARNYRQNAQAVRLVRTME